MSIFRKDNILETCEKNFYKICEFWFKKKEKHLLCIIK